MTLSTEEKETLQAEADRRTEIELQRIDSYSLLKYNFESKKVYDWLDELYNKNKVNYHYKEYPSMSKVRKRAGIGFLEYYSSFLGGNKKEVIRQKISESKKELYLEIDNYNVEERNRCDKYNNRLSIHYKKLLDSFIEGDPTVVEDYFTYVVGSDSFILDEYEYNVQFKLEYHKDNKQLVIDYKLPTANDVPQVEKWIIKGDTIEPKMIGSQYSELYERIILDISIRIVGLIFESDTKNLLDSIIFNGSCLYSDSQNKPTVLISFIIPKNTYSLEKVRKMDYVSKSEIAKLKEVRYLGDIHSDKASKDLLEKSPVKLVVPFKSVI